MGKIIYKPIIGIDLDTKNTIRFESRFIAHKLGYNTCKIGQSIKNPKFSYKNMLWIYEENYNQKEVDYIFTIIKTE